MLDLPSSDPVLLRLVDTVVTELLTKSTKLKADDIMVVGARCRDILQGALGHEFTLRATTDIDLGLAVANWTAYEYRHMTVTNSPDWAGTSERRRELIQAWERGMSV